MRNLWERNCLMIAVNLPIVVLVFFNIRSLNQLLLSGKALFSGPSPPLNNELQATRAKAEIRGAHGGQVFVAIKRRSYHGHRPFSSNTSTSGFSDNLYPRRAEQLLCNKWAVVTTIFGPTTLVRQLVGMKDWCVVVVGDKKSPSTYDIQSDTLIYLSPEEQEALPYQIIPLLKWNHFGRKNIGFLYAMHHGAEVIYDTDDDNILKVDSRGNPFIPDCSLGELALSKDVVRLGQSHVYNPYPSFESVHVKDGSHAFVWPRGFPVDLITDTSTWNVSRGKEEEAHEGGIITIVQSLADHDPDVDALYRLTNYLPLRFRSGGSARLEVISPGVMTPFNAQATIFGKVGFWGMLLPITVHGRVSDIWRSYVTGRIMWEAGQRLAFASPFVTQCRNPHSYVADFDAESDLYERAGALVSWLLEWHPVSNSIEGIIEEMAIALYEMDFLHDPLDVDLAIAWIQDLQGIGVAMPKTLSQSEKGYFIPRASGTVGSLKIVKSDGTCEQSSVTEPSLWAILPPSAPKARKPLALMVMTKDDMNLLSRFLAYHGDVFGFENIYVFDGSTGPQKAFLDSIAALYPIHVKHSLVDLNGIREELAQWIDLIKEDYEWIFKVDTDEFLVQKGDVDGGPALTNPALLLPTSNASNAILSVDHFYEAAPVMSGSPTETERSASSAAGKWKQFYNGEKFKPTDFNLGSHVFGNQTVAQGIAFVHYHRRSFIDSVRVATQTLMGHGYVNATDSKEEMINKLKKLDERPKCGQISCHKVSMVLDTLTNYEETRRQYHEKSKAWPTNLIGFREHLRKIFARYPSIVVN
ncbi:Protein of unknown function DUF288 [Nannochloropsis gaditana]|uniref:Uncharacterized protein n=1 Tax=Nannochloropsis gaditana TaxID=72520 RepID=W7SZI8_9STRA|nr:Protein of unknown function DUF288 [Nannochloropsis gaditana]